MRLREWALSTGNEGARSIANHQFIDGLLRQGCLVANPGARISSDYTEEQGVRCVRLRFHLPNDSHSDAGQSIAVLVPTACVGTDIIQAPIVFYALVEETILRLANIVPKHTLVRLYHHDNRQRHPRSYSSSWRHTHSQFSLLISSLRGSLALFPGLGQISSAIGVMEITQAMTSSDESSSDFVVTLTLSTKQAMALFLPRRVATLPRDFMLDWLDVQNEFSSVLL